MAYRDFIGTKSWSRGQRLEADFGALLKKTYPDARRATRLEQFKSIDWICEKGTIDVKAMKRLGTGQPIQDEFIWVEFKNNIGRDGWLYGEQDWLAFEAVEKYVIVRRKDLADLSEHLCDLNDKVTKSSDALYKSYTRSMHKDVISIIRFDDLYKIENFALVKEL